jgi:hypothetical protein
MSSVPKSRRLATFRTRPHDIDETADQPLISRRRALRIGAVKYWDPGTTCPQGHTSPRIAITDLCLECRYEYQQRAKLPKPIVKPVPVKFGRRKPRRQIVELAT